MFLTSVRRKTMSTVQQPLNLSPAQVARNNLTSSAKAVSRAEKPHANSSYFHFLLHAPSARLINEVHKIVFTRDFATLMPRNGRLRCCCTVTCGFQRRKSDINIARGRIARVFIALLYGLEACHLNKAGLGSLDFLVNRFFMKLLSTKKCSEGGIVFRSVRMCVCLSLCLSTR